VNVTLLDGSSLEKKIRSRSNVMLDETVMGGAEGLKCRLVAVRADDKLLPPSAEERGRKRVKTHQVSNLSFGMDGTFF